MAGITRPRSAEGAGDRPSRHGGPPVNLTSLRTYLLALVAASLLPMLASGGMALWLAASHFRTTSSERLQETATSLAHALDTGMEQNIAALQLAAVADRSGDADILTAYWRRATTAGEQTRIQLLAPGDPGQGTVAALAAQVRRERRMAVSDLFRSPGADQPLVAIAAPLQASPGQADILVLVQPSPRLITTVSRSNGHADLLFAVVDASGHLAARSRSPERYLGQPVPDWGTLKAMGSDHGVFQARTAEGAPIVFAFQMLSAAHGWALVVGEPLQSFRAHWETPLLPMALGGVLAAGIALVTALWISRRVLAPVQALARHGRAITLNDAGQPPPPPSRVREFEDMRRSLLQAESTLRRRAGDARQLAQDLERSRQRYRTIAQVGALVFWRLRGNGDGVWARGWSELTGQRADQARDDGWRQRIHPQDLGLLTTAWRHAVDEGLPLEVRFRLLDVDGQWRQVRARGARVLHEDGPARGEEWVGVLEDTGPH